MAESNEVMKVITGAKDSITGGYTIVDDDQHNTHLGRSFTASVNSTGVAANASIYVQFNSPPTTGYVHLSEVSITAIDTLVRYFILEATTSSTFTAGSTPILAWNRNRTSTNVPLATLFSNPTNVNSTNSSMINILKSIVLGSSGTAGGGGRGASADFIDSSIILKQNSTYIFELRNIGAGAGQLGMDLYWYRAATT